MALDAQQLTVARIKRRTSISDSDNMIGLVRKFRTVVFAPALRADTASVAADTLTPVPIARIVVWPRRALASRLFPLVVMPRAAAHAVVDECVAIEAPPGDHGECRLR